MKTFEKVLEIFQDYLSRDLRKKFFLAGMGISV